jgi:hypothetical protein
MKEGFNDEQVVLTIFSLIIFIIIELYTLGTKNSFMAVIFLIGFYYLIKLFIKKNGE